MAEDFKQTFLGTGRRKTAVAAVRLFKGTGKIRINKLEYEKYFEADQDRLAVIAPLQMTKTLGKYDVSAKVVGGGKTGQAGALVLGIARALCKCEPSLEGKLREERMLTRDPRMKERKKYGRKGARRGFQWTKR